MVKIDDYDSRQIQASQMRYLGIILHQTSYAKLIETIGELAPELIAIEACASAYYWRRRFLRVGRCVY